MRIFMGKLCLLAVSLYLSVGIYGQVPTPGAVTPVGVSDSPIYGSGFEQYNGFNGYLAASLPLHHVGGRGEAGFDLVWNMQPGWLAAYNGNPGNAILFAEPYPSANIAGATNNGFGLGAAGGVYIRTGFQWTACGTGAYGPSSTVTTVQFVMPNGGQLSLTDTASNGRAMAVPFNSCTGSRPLTWDDGRGTSFRSTDNSQIQFTASSNVLEQADNGHGYGVAVVSGTLVFPNGVKYTVTNSNITSMEDRNGNQISLLNTGPAVHLDWYLTVPGLSQITDSLNRITTINYNDTANCSGCLTITYPGAGSTSHIIKVLTGSLTNNLRPNSGYAIETTAALFSSSLYGSATTYSPTVASSIVMPDGNQYSLQYNPYGEIAHVTLPSGAAIEYDYAAGSGSNGGYLAGTGSFANIMIYRRLSERREYVNGGSGSSYSSKTDHVISTVSGNTLDTVSTYAPGSSTALSKTVHTFQGSPTDALTLTGTSCNALNEGFEMETDLGSPSALVTVVNSFTNGTFGGATPSCAYNETLSTRKTTLADTNQQSKVAYTYDQYGNVTDEKDYDWGSGAPSATVLREMQYAYQYTVNTSFASAAYNMVHLPWYVVTLNSDGTQASQSTFQYDQNSLTTIPSGSIVGHDSNYGTGQTLRGNVTSFYRTVAGTTLIGKFFIYDIAGNVKTANYDNGSTNFSYNDDAQGKCIFPTTVTDGAGYSATAAYDYNAGKPSSVKDARQNSTSYVYTEPFDRVTQITEPTGGQTQVGYAQPTWVITTHSQVTSGSPPVQSQVVYDGFGRKLQDRLLPDPNHFLGVLETYDALGRLSSQSNPTLVTNTGGNDGLGYLTVPGYDSLSRVVSVTTPDGNITTTGYSGNTTTVTDPSSNATQTTVDALGRATLVVEDPGSSPHLNLQTWYTYNALGNLTKVLKCNAGGSGNTCAGQARSFSYDQLGRQTQAINPESGTVNYSYVLSGAQKEMLQSRTDARGSVTNYSYDADDRLTGVTYADGTVPQKFSYDANGNLLQAVAGTVSNGVVSGIANNFTYDASNRTLTSSLQIATPSVNQTYNFSYGYDLAGDLVSETYPSLRVITTGFDMAMRPINVGYTVGSTTTPYVTGVSYWPHGAFYYLLYSNNVSPVENYSKLLQPTLFYDTQASNVNAFYFYNQNYYNANGTVNSVVEGYGNKVAGSSLTGFNQFFTYDNLNRLTNVQDQGYDRGFGYDEFGNMGISFASGILPSGIAPIMSQNPFNRANNRLISATYGDARGNMTAIGAVSMGYDGESRQTQMTDTGTGQSIQYLYDGLGQRVEKVISGGATTVFVHDAFGSLAAEYNSAGVTPACATCYLSYDQLGSTRMITDQFGNVVARHDYLPYGEEIPNGVAGRSGNFASSGNVTQMFTGQERDGGTAVLDYFNARHLSAVTGGFTQVDPGNAGASVGSPQSWNGYAYALGNPMVYTDPSGMGGEYSGIEDGNCYSAWREMPCEDQSIGIGIVTWGTGSGGGSPSPGRVPPGEPPTEPSTPSSAVPFSCDLFGCWSASPVNWTPTIGPCVFAPSGTYNVKNGVNLRFESATASHLSSAISVMNSSGVTPTITDGFRTALDQAIRIGDPRSITPAKINQSLHQSGSAVDIRIDDNSAVVNQSMTNAGFTWGGVFRTPDPVHYQMGPPGSRPNPNLAKACGGWHY